ncbi:MAG: hypothetical protein J6X05_09195 [Bacteroidales bacterium]|nr:hypothetical protein [Bacteroidales bacterium]
MKITTAKPMKINTLARFLRNATQRNVNTLKHHGNHGGVQAAASYFNPLWMADNAFRKGFLFS